MAIQSVTFENISPRTKTVVALDDAWDYFLSHPFERVKMATIERDGETFETYAKQYISWDFDNQIFRISDIGFGAYGDQLTPNPAKSNWKFSNRYQHGHWTTGFDVATGA